MNWKSLVSIFAPVVAMAIPGGSAFASLVPILIRGINEAEQIKGTGAQKKAHAMEVVLAAATGTNAALVAAGKAPALNVADVQATVSHGIDAVIGVVNLVEKASDSAPRLVNTVVGP